MASLVPAAEEMLAYALQRLQAITPEQFEAPDDEEPEEPIHFMGYATDAQRAMSTLLKQVNREHEALHEAVNLSFGAHPNLPMNHRKLHTTINVVEELLYEDLTQTFEPVGEREVYIDDQWRVYWVDT